MVFFSCFAGFWPCKAINNLEIEAQLAGERRERVWEKLLLLNFFQFEPKKGILFFRCKKKLATKIYFQDRKAFFPGKVTNIEYGNIDFENVNIETVTSTRL